jgi:hypothetical protein
MRPDHGSDRYFEFGCLYDLTVQILPANGTTVVQVLKEQDFPTSVLPVSTAECQNTDHFRCRTICAGSGILLLAELRANRPLALNTRSEGHVRQRSDELIEDLELQLGDLRTEYMRVRLCYAHSAFPQHEDIEERNGISSVRTSMETVAVASLKRCNGFSPWSPHPAPAPNTLFQLIAQHWGSEKANEAMQKMLSQRSTPRKVANGGGSPIHQKLETPAAATPDGLAHANPQVQRGQSSYQCCGSPSTGESCDRTSKISTTSMSTTFSEVKHCTSGARLDPLTDDMSAMTYDSHMYHGDPSETSSGWRGFNGAESSRHRTSRLGYGDDNSTDVSERQGLRATVRSKKKELSRWGWASWF